MERRIYKILIHLIVSLNVALAGKLKLKSSSGEATEDQKFKIGSLHLQLRAETYNPRDSPTHEESVVDVEDLIKLIRAIATNHLEEIRLDDSLEKSINYYHRSEQFFENNDEENDSQKTIYRYDKSLTMERRIYEILLHLIVSLNVALAGKLKLKSSSGEATDGQKFKTGSLHLQLRAEKYNPRDSPIHEESVVDVEDLIKLIRAIATNHLEEIRPDDALEKSKNYYHRSEHFFENNDEENDSQKTIYRYDKILTMERRIYEILLHLIVSLNVALTEKVKLKNSSGEATEGQKFKTGSLHLQLRAEKYNPRDSPIHEESVVDVEDLIKLIRAIATNHLEQIQPDDSLEKSKNYYHRSEQFFENNVEENDSQKTIYRYDKSLTMERRIYEILLHLIVSLNVALAEKLKLKSSSGETTESQKFKTGSLHLQLRAEKYNSRNLAIYVETSVDIEDLVRLIRAIVINHPKESLEKSKNDNNLPEPFSENDDNKKEDNYMESQKTLYRYYQGETSTRPSIVYEERSNGAYRTDDENDEGARQSNISYANENDTSSAYNEDQTGDFSSHNINTNININGKYQPASQPKTEDIFEVGPNNEKDNETVSSEEIGFSGKKIDENSDEGYKPLGGIPKFSDTSTNASREDGSSKRKYVMDVLLEAINTIIPRNMSMSTEPANTEKFSR